MELAMRRMVFALGLLFVATLVLGVLLGPAPVPTAPGDWWQRYLIDRQLFGTRPTIPLADPTFGILIVVLLGLWARATWGGQPDDGQPLWRARKSDPQPGGADVIAQTSTSRSARCRCARSRSLPCSRRWIPRPEATTSSAGDRTRRSRRRTCSGAGRRRVRPRVWC